MKNYDNKFREFLKREFKKAGIKLEELATILNTNQSSISRMLRNERHLDFGEIVLIAEFLGVSPAELLAAFEGKNANQLYKLTYGDLSAIVEDTIKELSAARKKLKSSN